MPSPKPKPTALKVLEGRSGGRDSGGRPIKDVPEFEGGEPPIPIWLAPEAVAEWKRTTPELVRLGILKLANLPTWAAYCQCWARFVEASKIVAEEGMVLHDDKQGRAQRHPALLTAEAASKELRALAAEFGLTPSAEARLGHARDNGGDEANPFAGAA